MRHLAARDGPTPHLTGGPGDAHPRRPGADQPMRLTELSSALGVNRTTGHRALTFLRHAGYVQRDKSGMFFIGPRLYYIGSAYVDRLPVVQAARPYLKAAVEETDATAQLVERHGSRRWCSWCLSHESSSSQRPRSAIISRCTAARKGWFCSPTPIDELTSSTAIWSSR